MHSSLFEADINLLIIFFNEYYSNSLCVCSQAQKKDQSKFYGELLEKRRTEAEKEQEKYVILM